MSAANHRARQASITVRWLRLSGCGGEVWTACPAVLHEVGDLVTQVGPTSYTRKLPSVRGVLKPLFYLSSMDAFNSASKKEKKTQELRRRRAKLLELLNAERCLQEVRKRKKGE